MEKQPAVFYDVDGTLLKSNIVYIYLYYALRQASLSSRAREFLKIIAASPVYKFMDLFSRRYFNQVFYKNYKGMNIDRLNQMGEELARDVLLPNVYPEMRHRVELSKKMGYKQVLVTGSLQYVIAPFARELGIEYWITNQLELDDHGCATGKLVEPILAGKGKTEVMEAFAEKHNIDLKMSYGFADSKADLEMLEAVGFPVAVNPDATLADIAHKRHWAIANI